MPHQSYSTPSLFIRTLLPSVSSISAGLVSAGVITMGHFLTISLSTGTILPQDPNSDLSIGYTNYVVGPILHLTNSSFFSLALTVIAWGTVGWLLVSLTMYIVAAIKEWHAAETDVEVDITQTVQHPRRTEHLSRVLWRLTSLFFLVLFIVLVQPVIHALFSFNRHLFTNPVASQVFLGLSLEILIWSLLFHCMVVFLRFYYFRTRIFGELLY